MLRFWRVNVFLDKEQDVQIVDDLFKIENKQNTTFTNSRESYWKDLSLQLWCHHFVGTFFLTHISNDPVTSKTNFSGLESTQKLTFKTNAYEEEKLACVNVMQNSQWSCVNAIVLDSNMMQYDCSGTSESFSSIAFSAGHPHVYKAEQGKRNNH